MVRARKKTPSQKIAEKTLTLRKQLWPEVTDEMIWHRLRKKGFTTMPRTMTFIMQIMNSLSSGKPPGQTYLTLWCRTFDEYMVKVSNPRVLAFESGFTGQRGETAWRERIKILVQQGFIDVKPGAAGPYSYILILNPYTVIQRLKAEGEPIPVEIYNSLLERAKDIGAKDMD